MVPLIGARPPPVPLVVAGGRTDTTLTAAMAAAAAAVMARVARVTVAAARTGNASDKVRDHQPLSSCPFVWLTSLRMAHAVSQAQAMHILLHMHLLNRLPHHFAKS